MTREEGLQIYQRHTIMFDIVSVGHEQNRRDAANVSIKMKKDTYKIELA